MDKLIIEARVNEFMMRTQGNPHVPYSSQEIVADALACRKAGAAVLHFHARKPDGAPDHATESYAQTVRAIRQSSDILVHPTLGDVALEAGPEKRLAHILEMMKDPATGPHMAPADMDSLNIDIYNSQARRFETKERVYQNSTSTLTQIDAVLILLKEPYLTEPALVVRCGALKPPVTESIKERPRGR